MSISVTCDACGREYLVKDDAAGRQFTCKDCGLLLSVPMVPAAAGSETAREDPSLEAAPVVRRRSDAKRDARRSAAKDEVALPAIFLMVAAGLWMAVLVVAMGFDIVILATGKAAELGRPEELVPHETAVMVRMIWNVLMIGTSSLILFGGWSMHQLRSRTLAHAAAILSVIPCIAPCYCGALPLGIWALMVLSKPEVRDGFP